MAAAMASDSQCPPGHLARPACRGACHGAMLPQGFVGIFSAGIENPCDCITVTPVPVTVRRRSESQWPPGSGNGAEGRRGRDSRDTVNASAGPQARAAIQV